MTAGESHQANDFSRDPYFHSTPQQAHNQALQNAWVSLRHWDILRFANAHYQCASLFRSRLLLPMANLKTIKRIYLRQSGVLLVWVECKIRTTSTRHIKAWQTIVFNH